MRCPFCYEKINEYSNVCSVCGFRKTELDSASNKLVDQMRKKDPDSIINVTTIPSDVNSKKLFWLCLLGGLLGLHSFYVKRYFKGIFSAVCTTILLVCTPIIYGDIMIFKSLISNPTFTGYVGVFGALAVFFWVSDFIKIVFRRFKIPVVLKDRL